MIVKISHQYVAVIVESHRLRIVQSTRSCSTFTRASDHTLETIRYRTDDPMILSFDNEQIAISIEDDTRWPVQYEIYL